MAFSFTRPKHSKVLRNDLPDPENNKLRTQGPFFFLLAFSLSKCCLPLWGNKLKRANPSMATMWRGVSHFQKWTDMLVRSHDIGCCQTSLVPPKMESWSHPSKVLASVILHSLIWVSCRSSWRTQGSAPSPKPMLSKRCESLKALKEKIARVTQGSFQSKVVMGARAFSTLQVSFGQHNFVSKRTEKAKTITRG